MNRENVSLKSFLATVLLALFGGVWGLHRFYCGKILTAVLQLVLWIFSIVKIAIIKGNKKSMIHLEFIFSRINI